MRKTRVVRLGSPGVHNNLRVRAGDSTDGVKLHLFRDTSISPILNQRRRLQSVLIVIQGIRSSDSLLLVDQSYLVNGIKS